MSKKRIIFDLDETLCTKKGPNETYADVQPIHSVIKVLNHLYDNGYEIIISTARNMVTQSNHVSKVVKNVGLDTMNWLERHGVKYHGLQWGKEYGVAYVDDKSLRPKELLELFENNMFDKLDEYLKDDLTSSIINRSIETVMNKHYVYQWFYYNGTEKHVFYVGKGSKFRAWDIKGRNEVFKKIHNNFNCEVEIVNIFNDEKLAFNFEKELKYKYIENGQCEACLDDIRGRISPMKGKPAWNRGENYKPKKIHPLGKKQPKKESHKQKIRNSNIGKHNHSGELNPGSKLNEEKVIKICELLNQNIHPSKISILFNVSEVTIHRIKGRKAWKKIGEIYLKPKVSMSEAISLNLNDQKVIEICNLLNDDTDINVIVEKFNVTPGVIKRIKNRKTWKHISDKYLKGEMK